MDKESQKHSTSEKVERESRASDDRVSGAAEQPTQRFDQDEDDFDSGPLKFGCILDGNGGARRVHWDEVKNWKPGKTGEVLWAHLRRDNPEARRWIEDDNAVPPRTTTLLLSESATPVAYRDRETLVSVLRGVGRVCSHRPESRVLVQLWSDGERLISLREDANLTIGEVMEMFGDNEGPKDAGALFAWLVRRTIDGMARAIIQMDDEIDDLEDANLDTGNPSSLLKRIGELRRYSLALERHMGVQHNALEQIVNRAPSWFGENDKDSITATVNRLAGYLIDIEISKESAAALVEEIRAHSAARTRFTNMVISVFSTIFLPLTFLTGLLGINVGGIPGSNDPTAFWIVCAMCLAIFVLQVIAINRTGFLRGE